MQVLFSAILAALWISATAGASNSHITSCKDQPDTRLAALTVRALTPDRKAMEGLAPGDFVLKNRLAAFPVCGFTHARQPASVGVLLDTSDSMRGNHSNLFGIGQAAIDSLLKGSGPDDEYFLEYVNSLPAMKCIFSRDLERIRAGVGVRPNGPTALFDAVYLALQAMDKASHANRSLVVVSDGLENQSKRGFKELKKAFAVSTVPLFLIVPDERWHRARRDVDVREWAERTDVMWLAHQSGGYSVRVLTDESAASAAAELGNVIRSPYYLNFAVPAAPEDSKDLRALYLEVKGAGPKPMLFYKALFPATKAEK